MKKLLALFLSLVFFTQAQAGDVNQIVFFGDSLTDNGNLYRLILKILPKSPPYFNGRFSNGYTWAEYVGKHYYQQKYIDYKIYALGGATAVFHLPSTDFIAPTTLELEVDNFLIDSLFRDKSKTLYSIWIGGNDYLFDSNVEPNQATQDVVDRIIWSIKTLASYGGKYFLVLNLPDLSRVPYIQDNAKKAKLHTLSLLHNEKLAKAIADLKSANPAITINYFNVYDMYNELIDHPDIYNQKYNVNITNTTQACWTGGYLFKNILTTQAMSEDIKQTLLAKNEKFPKNFDFQAVSQYIIHNPALANTYVMGKSYELGVVPCANADEYMFWDSIHPTETVHRVFAQIVIESLGNII